MAIKTCRSSIRGTGNRGSQSPKRMTILISICFLLIPLQTAWTQAPSWTVQPSAYEASMNVIGVVFQDGARLDHSDALVGAFVGDEVRGVAMPTNVAGQLLFFLTVYSNDEGEILSFKAYDPTSDQVLLLKETLSFERDRLHGSIAAPFTWSTISPASRPDWRVDPAAFQHSMNVVGALFVDGVRSSHPYDLVAAMVGNDVRGVASPIQVAGDMLFFLTIFGDNSGETVTFQAYDTASDQVYSLEENLTFESDARHGSIAGPFAWNTSAGTEQPDWVVDPAAFEHSMNVVGALFVDGIRSAHPSDLVAAFVGAEVRGVASPIEVVGQMLFFLTIFSDSSGENVTFQAYHTATDQVQVLGETLTFEAGALHGSPAQPFAWNSRSDNARPDWQVDPSAYESNMSIIGMVSPDVVPLSHPGDLVVAMVGNEVHGLASPTVVAGQTLFFLTVYGNIANETIMFQVYNTSSNQVQAISTVVPFRSDAIYGSTDRPLLWKVDLTPIGSDVVVQPEDAVTGSAPVSISYAEVIESGTTTLVIKDSGPSVPAGFQLVSTTPKYYDISTTATFAGVVSISITYEEPQSAEVDETEFMLLHFESGEFVDITISVDVDANVITGETQGFSIFAVVAPAPPVTSIEENELTSPADFSVSPNFPNPFNAETTIELLLPEGQDVVIEIYDIHGSKVRTLLDAWKDTGRHRISWNGEDDYGTLVSSGVYLIQVETGVWKIVEKVTMLK